MDLHQRQCSRTWNEKTRREYASNHCLTHAWIQRKVTLLGAPSSRPALALFLCSSLWLHSVALALRTQTSSRSWLT